MTFHQALDLESARLVFVINQENPAETNCVFIGPTRVMLVITDQQIQAAERDIVRKWRDSDSMVYSGKQHYFEF